MPLQTRYKELLLAAFLTLTVPAASIWASQQPIQERASFTAPESLSSGTPSAKEEEIFARLVQRNEARSAALKEYSATRTYSLSNSEGNLQAKEIVRMQYIAPDKKTFVKVSEEGSGVVRKLVLNRLMDTEVSTASGKEHRDSSITPANYVFHFLGEEDLGPYHCIVVEALPKRRDKYLFEGKVWIDRTDFAIVRITGHPAKKLSFWVTQADFIRQYEKAGDFWLPVKDETFVDVRLYGRKVLRIEHSLNSVNGKPIDGQVAAAEVH